MTGKGNLLTPLVYFWRQILRALCSQAIDLPPKLHQSYFKVCGTYRHHVWYTPSTWCYTGRFATTIFSATQRCYVRTMLWLLETKSQQCCNAVSRLKSCCDSSQSMRLRWYWNLLKLVTLDKNCTNKSEVFWRNYALWYKRFVRLYLSGVVRQNIYLGVYMHSSCHVHSVVVQGVCGQIQWLLWVSPWHWHGTVYRTWISQASR